MNHRIQQWRREHEDKHGKVDERDFATIVLLGFRDRLAAYAKEHVFGADFDPSCAAPPR